MPPDQLFSHAWVRVRIGPEDMPGYKSPQKTLCDTCGERVNFERQVVQDGRLLCRGCAGGAYYEVLHH